MQEYIEKRVLEICDYMIQTGATVRQAAAQFESANRRFIRI